MARYYPPLVTGEDACPVCRGTGRVTRKPHAGQPLFYGDNTEACGTCWGTGGKTGLPPLVFDALDELRRDGGL